MIKPTNTTEQYRDLLELWAAWWDGPGRKHYEGYIVPPLRATRETLGCMVCCGIQTDDRCQACSHDMSL